MFGYTMKITYSNLVIFIFLFPHFGDWKPQKSHFSEFWISFLNHELSNAHNSIESSIDQMQELCQCCEWNLDLSQSEVCFLFA